jgi:tetratricopeptide (TPR) repeat protein
VEVLAVKQKPFRWEPWIISDMSTEAIVAKMKELVPRFDLSEFVEKTRQYLSAEDLSEAEYYPYASFSDQDEDFIWMACEELWKRLIPSRLAVEHIAEQLDDKLDQMGKAEEKRKWQRAIKIGKEAFDVIRPYIIEETPAGHRLRHDFYEKLRRTGFYDVDSFLDDFLTMLFNEKEYEYALEVATILAEAFDDGSFLNYKAECLFALGRKDEGEQCCQSWMACSPMDVWPFIYAGDGFFWYREKDYNKAKGYYLKALDVARANSATPDGKIDMEAVYDRLADLSHAMGNHSEEMHYRRLVNALRAQPQKKIGRNDPCPCGSGKKYKKCCGREVTPESQPPPFDRRIIERDLLAAKQLLEEKKFSSVGEMNRYLEGIRKGGKMPEWKAKTPLEKAQNLIYEALETTGRKRFELIYQALDICSDCADAYVLLAEEKAQSLDEAAALYLAGVKAGERALGKKVFKRDAGHFWSIIETRPYMRARAGLAQCLWFLGKHEEATRHYWELLRLNPSDNQGIRYLLAAALLEMGEIGSLEELLGKYDEPTAAWLYTKALVAYVKQGDTAEARERLEEAMDYNPHVVPYLLGKKRFPKQLAQRIGFGDEDEAVVYATEFGPGWHKTRGAIDWLALVSGTARGT